MKSATWIFDGRTRTYPQEEPLAGFRTEENAFPAGEVGRMKVVASSDLVEPPLAMKINGGHVLRIHDVPGLGRAFPYPVETSGRKSVGKTPRLRKSGATVTPPR